MYEENRKAHKFNVKWLPYGHDHDGSHSKGTLDFTGHLVQ
jgi:hypothetical protein